MMRVLEYFLKVKMIHTKLKLLMF